MLVVDLPAGRKTQQKRSDAAAIALAEAAFFILLRPIPAVEVQPSGGQARSAAAATDAGVLETEVPGLLAAGLRHAGSEIPMAVRVPAITGANNVRIQIQADHRRCLAGHPGR